MCDFILQIFKDLDRMCMNKLQISGGQKMSKREQERKIKAVREQINTLKLRVTKLESCLCTLKGDPDQYFQNLNTENREYVDWKKRNVKSEKDEENKSSNEEEEEDCGATTASTGAADIFRFFQTMVGFFIVLPHQYRCGEDHDPLLLHMDTLPLDTTHHTHVLQGAVCPFLHWVAYFPPCLIIHLTSLHLHLFLFMELMSHDSASSDTCWNTSNTNTPSTSNTSSSTSGSSTTYTPQHYTGCCCADCVKNMLINTLIPLFPVHILTFNFNA